MEYLLLSFACLDFFAGKIDTCNKITGYIGSLVDIIKKLKNKNVSKELDKIDVLFLLNLICNLLNFINNGAQYETVKKKFENLNVENYSNQANQSNKVSQTNKGLELESIDDEIIQDKNVSDKEIIITTPESKSFMDRFFLLFPCCHCFNSDKNKYQTIEYKIDNNDNPIIFIIGEIHYIIEEIHHELEVLNEKLIKHKNKFFKKIRKLNVEKNLENISIRKLQLQNRYDLLISVSSFIHTKDRLCI